MIGLLSCTALSDHNKQVIADTLKFRLPYKEVKDSAQEVPTVNEIKQYCEVLNSELRLDPSYKDFDISVEWLNHYLSTPWRCINIKFCKEDPHKYNKQFEHFSEKFIKTANDTTINPFIIPYNETSFLVGILAQKQYWSISEARLLAMKISEFDFTKAIG